jgi:hypothetical protein
MWGANRKEAPREFPVDDYHTVVGLGARIVDAARERSVLKLDDLTFDAQNQTPELVRIVKSPKPKNFQVSPQDLRQAQLTTSVLILDLITQISLGKDKQPGRRQNPKNLSSSQLLLKDSQPYLLGMMQKHPEIMMHATQMTVSIFKMRNLVPPVWNLNFPTDIVNNFQITLQKVNSLVSGTSGTSGWRR